MMLQSFGVIQVCFVINFFFFGFNFCSLTVIIIFVIIKLYTRIKLRLLINHVQV